MNLGLSNTDLRVSIDVGCKRHAVALGHADGSVVDEFEFDHDRQGFAAFFDRVEGHAGDHSVAVAMEGYNGHARPMDRMVQQRGWRLFNINNLKLARFKEIFPAPAKSDQIDARKGLELFQICDHLPLAKNVLQEVEAVPKDARKLQRLTRRRRALVDEKVRVSLRMQTDLRAVCPELLAITTDVERLWFLRFLGCRKELTALARLHRSSLLKIPSVGKTFADRITGWQTTARFSDDVSWVGSMIVDDARRLLCLRDQIKALEADCETLNEGSRVAQRVQSIPGFGLISSATLAGEIGTISRFERDASLALYLGMAPLVKQSGNSKGTKPPRSVNHHAKLAMMTAVDRHRKFVPESQRYYEKKRLEGKAHNQAIRCLGRHLVRVIYRMLRDDCDYVVKV